MTTVVAVRKGGQLAMMADTLVTFGETRLSNRNFTLGAMHAASDKVRTARKVVGAGMAAACEFDRNSALPAEVFTLKLKVSK